MPDDIGKYSYCTIHVDVIFHIKLSCKCADSVLLAAQRKRIHCAHFTFRIPHFYEIYRLFLLYPVIVQVPYHRRRHCALSDNARLNGMTDKWTDRHTVDGQCIVH